MNVDTGEDNKQSNTAGEQAHMSCQISEKSEAREGTTILLKARGKIVKKSQTSRLKTKNKKSGVKKGKNGFNGDRYMNSGESSKVKHKRTSDEVLCNNDIAENNEMEVKEHGVVDDDLAIKHTVAQAQSEKDKTPELHKGQQKQERERYARFPNNDQQDNESHDGEGKTPTTDTIKERLGGLIFMCSGKTKPDCFHYRIMGVSNRSKDIVLGIKPGVKLFLFDFDLKLLYGIYSASSCGGMKLEPKAFGGAFPVQVRFNIDRDCYPLPESIFKKAIQDNYDGKNRFKTELTVKQVRKLIQLFRPVGIHSLPSVASSQCITIPGKEIRDGFRGAQANSRRESLARDHYDNVDIKTHGVLSHSRDLGASALANSHRESLSGDHCDNADVRSHNVLSRTRDLGVSDHAAGLAWRNEIPRDLFITKTEYRAYALNSKGRNVPFPGVNPATSAIRHSDLHSSESEYRGNVHGPSAPRSLYSSTAAAAGTSVSRFSNSHELVSLYGRSSAETLLHPLREEVASGSFLADGRRLIEADNLGRREIVRDRLHSDSDLGRTDTVQDRYLRYPADRLVEYHQTPSNGRTHLEPSSLPVSSRYSFPSPSHMHR